MPDFLSLLDDLGRASVSSFWVPVISWTVLALVAEAGLRLGRANAALSLPVRSALLAALPVSIGLGAVVRLLLPSAASAVAAVAPVPIVRLPEIVVGAPPATAVAESAPLASDAVIGVLVLIVALVGFVGLVRLILQARALRQLQRALPSAPPEIQHHLDQALARLGIARGVRAVEAPRGVAPFTVGWRQPVVAVPLDLDASALDAVLTHELAHVARGDFAWYAAQRAVTAAFAAHPLVHALGRGLDLDRERAADAAVLSAHPGARRAYADLLLSYASLPPPPFALGAGPGVSSLKSRIDAMTRPLSPTRLRHLLRLGRMAGAFAIVLATGLAIAAAAPVGPVDSPSAVSDAERTVEGTVTDADTGEPLIGANVMVSGTDLGAATDIDGRYRINDVPDGPQTIEISFVGYETRAIRVAADRTELDAALTTGNASRQPARTGSRTGNRAEAPDIFEVAEVQPELIGGLSGLQERVVYPQDAKDEGVEGQVVIQFVVNEEGVVQDAVALRSPDERLSEAALAAVRASRFVPGRQRGEPVKVRFAVPVSFRLPGSTASSVDDARAAQYPNARLTASGIDPALFGDATLFNQMLIGVGQIVRESQPALPDGSQATIRFRLDDRGRIVANEIETVSPNSALGNLSRGLVGLLSARPHPDLAGRSFELTTTYVRGD